MNRQGYCIAALIGALLSAAPAFAQKYVADIRWTQYGVPHVKAKDYAGLGFGYGYVVARDELCIVADLVLSVRGERSRWFGPDAATTAGLAKTTNLNSDLFFRVQLPDTVVHKAEKELSPAAHALVRGYAAGFNRYVHDLKPEARAAGCHSVPIPTLQSTDLVRNMMHVGALWISRDVAAANGGVESGEHPIGSNAWAYGSDVTRTGASIVVANPHTSWAPSWQRMHQVQLTIPGEIDVSGADFAGLPVLVAGFTRDLAWSIKSPQGVRYHVLLKLDLPQRRDITYRPLTFDVRNADGKVAPRTFRIPYSKLGPIYKLEAAPGRPAGWYAITDPNAGNARGIDQMLAAARARTMPEFKAAIAKHRGITARLIAGDRYGEALYIEAGPLLDIDDATLKDCAIDAQQESAKQRIGPPGILDGARAECTIRTPGGEARLLPASRLPAVITRGAVQFAGTSYRYAIFGQSLGGYSLLLGDSREPPGPRALMSQKMLSEVLTDGTISMSEATDVLFSNRNYAAETSLDSILGACTLAKPDSRAAGACEILSRWDRRNDPQSRGALLFNEAWPRLQALSHLSGEPVLTALDQTVAGLNAVQLKGDEPWGRMLARSTAGGRVPLHGGSAEQGVLNVIDGGPLGPDGYSDIRYGSSYTHVVSWVDGKLVGGVLLTHGQSTDRTSPHYADQLPLFARKQLAPLRFTDAEIEADPAYSLSELRH